MNISSLSPDEAVNATSPSLAEHFKQFQDLIRSVTDSLQIPVKEMEELHHKLFDSLPTASSAHIALPVNDPANVICHTSASIPPMYKRANKKYCVASQESEFLFSHTFPNSLGVEAVNECGRQHHTKAMPYDKNLKCLNCLGRKPYSSAT